MIIYFKIFLNFIFLFLILMETQMDIEEENILPNEETIKEEINNEKNKISTSNEINNINGMEEEKEKDKCIVEDSKIIINKNILNLGPPNHILIPRLYQQRIYSKAKNQNSIIYLETGRGKTFISIMLMADLLGIKLPVFEKPNNINKNTKIIFLVCDTALIEQQKNTIALNLNIEVGTIQGKKNKKAKNDLSTFRKMWESFNIFVAIPTILYKLLSKGFLKISEINMIVFDECHHANADHPYNKIMNEFYFFYKKHPNKKDFKDITLPIIIGLTASPLKSSIKGSIGESAQKAMESLSENLDCSIVIDPDMIKGENIDKNIKEGKDIYQEDYFIPVNPHNSSESYSDLINIIYECFDELLKISINDLSKRDKEYKEIDKDFVEDYKNYFHSKFNSENLSDYNTIVESNMYLYSLRNKSPFFYVFEQMQRQIFIIISNLCLDSIILFFNRLIEIYQKLMFSDSNFEYNSNNSYIYSSLDDNEDDYVYDNNSFTLDELNQLNCIFMNTKYKLTKLKEKKNYICDRLIQMFKKIDEIFASKKESKIIIFIGNRIVAYFLSPILGQYLTKNHPSIKCKEIIGLNKHKTNNGTILTQSTTLNELNKTISDFNNNKINILIGTSAVEEGLDIQTCNAVMVFVELMTAKSYIQMKGRARCINSKFYLFTNSVENTVKRINDFIEIGNKMKEFFKDDICRDFRKKKFIKLKPEIKPIIFNNISHAKLSLSNSTEFFNEIKQQISNNNFKLNFDIKIDKVKSKAKSKTIEFEFLAVLKIKDTNLNIIKSGKDKEYKTKRMPSKTAVERDCHFHLLELLYNGNYLDEHFKFIYEK